VPLSLAGTVVLMWPLYNSNLSGAELPQQPLALRGRRLDYRRNGTAAHPTCLVAGRHPARFLELAAVANLGRRPTFGKLQDNFEVHLFDFSGDLYGKILRVALVDFIRPEMKFGGLDQLKAQIAADGEAARRILKIRTMNRRAQLIVVTTCRERARPDLSPWEVLDVAGDEQHGVHLRGCPDHRIGQLDPVIATKADGAFGDPLVEGNDLEVAQEASRCRLEIGAGADHDLHPRDDADRLLRVALKLGAPPGARH